ncbi:MAG: DUF6062 family protein [Clostridia bacterium]|nr:DUF6062 family protein [Clostridia bacterium]
MRDDICTIPVSEVFEVKDGCPICRMRHTVEEKILNYILGDAMMEPDVRIETNKKGFCTEHLNKMMNRRGRLQLALMLETHIKEVNSKIFEKNFLNGANKKAGKIEKLSDSCFICDKMDWGFEHMIDTIYRCYEKERDFRNLFDAQPQFCMPHYELLINGANKKNMPKYYKEFCSSITKITAQYTEKLCEDISKYCMMYDYRSSAGKDADWGDSKTAVERIVAFLNGEIPKE